MTRNRFDRRKHTRARAAGLALAVALVALLGFARPAHALQTELEIYNNTGVPLVNPVVSNWSNGQYWALNQWTTSQGPPGAIPPGGHAIFLTDSGFGVRGTGGTITYTPEIPSSLQASMPTDTVDFIWSTPYVPGVGPDFWSCSAQINSRTFTAARGWHTDTGDTEDAFNVVGGTSSDGTTHYTCDDAHGESVTWEVNQTKPIAGLAMPMRTVGGGWSGNVGDPLSIVGVGFNGSTQVLFGTSPATLACSSASACTATVPWGQGVVPVTVRTNGSAPTTLTSQFSYLATPGCTYAASGGQVTATCGSDAALDPVWILQENAAGVYNVVYTFPRFADLGPTTVLTGAPPGTINLLSCVVNESGHLDSAPGTPGCDNFPTAVTVTVPDVCWPGPFPRCIHNH